MSSSSAVQSPNLSVAFLSELQYEAATTRKVLERIPESVFDWKPHEKSMSFARLAAHVAEMFSWIPTTLETTELDFAGKEYKPFEPKTNGELLEYFDKSAAQAIESLQNASDETFAETWTMRNGETVYFTMPKTQVLRSFCINHIIHHRGQLSVYLRLNEIPVPEIYGPSADEGKM